MANVFRILKILANLLLSVMALIVVVGLFQAVSRNKDMASNNPRSLPLAQQLNAAIGELNSQSVSVRKERMSYDTDLFWYLTLTSRTNKIILLRVIINRGNCKNFAWSGEGQTLLFGQSIKLNVTNCNPIEVQVRTDQGDFTATLDE